MKQAISSVFIVASILICGSFLNGCSPWATYPPVETKAAQSMTRETFEPVPTVMAVALVYARDKYMAGQEDIAINLPLGTPAAVYDKVIKKLGWGHPMLLANDPALHVTEVRTRGFNGQVDLIYHRADGLNQMVTISMSRTAFESYKVTGTRVWQMRDLKAPSPNYVPPPPPPVKEEKPAK